MSQKVLLTKEEVEKAIRYFFGFEKGNVSVLSVEPHFVIHEDRGKHTLEERFEGYVVEVKNNY